MSSRFSKKIQQTQRIEKFYSLSAHTIRKWCIIRIWYLILITNKREYGKNEFMSISRIRIHCHSKETEWHYFRPIVHHNLINLLYPVKVFKLEHVISPIWLPEICNLLNKYQSHSYRVWAMLSGALSCLISHLIYHHIYHL